MKFKVNYYIDDEEMMAGRKPHSEIYDSIDDFVEAENAEEAICNAIDYLADKAKNNGFDAEIDRKNMRVTFSKPGEPIEQYYNFFAESQYNKKHFIIECRGQLRTVADYTADEIVNAFWSDAAVNYSDESEFDSLEDAQHALRSESYNAYTTTEEGFIDYRFYQIQERTFDEDGEIIDLRELDYLAKNIIIGG